MCYTYTRIHLNSWTILIKFSMEVADTLNFLSVDGVQLL